MNSDGSKKHKQIPYNRAKTYAQRVRADRKKMEGEYLPEIK